MCGTIVAMTFESLRSARDHFSELAERVHRHRERVTVTRNGIPAVVLISPDDLEELEETIAVLSDPAALAEIREAEVALAAGDFIGAEELRAKYLPG